MYKAVFIYTNRIIWRKAVQTPLLSKCGSASNGDERCWWFLSAAWYCFCIGNSYPGNQENKLSSKIHQLQIDVMSLTTALMYYSVHLTLIFLLLWTDPGSTTEIVRRFSLWHGPQAEAFPWGLWKQLTSGRWALGARFNFSLWSTQTWVLRGIKGAALTILNLCVMIMHLLLCALDANCMTVGLELANHSKSRTNGDCVLDGSDTHLHIVSSLKEGTSC